MNLAYVRVYTLFILFHFIHVNFELFSVVNFLCITLFVFLIFSNNIPQGGFNQILYTARQWSLCVKSKASNYDKQEQSKKIYRLLFQIDLPLLN